MFIALHELNRAWAVHANTCCVRMGPVQARRGGWEGVTGRNTSVHVRCDSVVLGLVEVKGLG